MNQKNLILNHSTILDSLVKLNKVGEIKLLFVVDKDNKVIGTLSDGDIRRSLVLDNDLYKRIDTICNRNFSYIKDLKE